MRGAALGALPLALAFCWPLGAVASSVPATGWSEDQALAWTREFERLTGYAGRLRALTARVERVEGPNGARRKLAGLPRGPQIWADGPGLDAGRSALVAASAGSGDQAQCVVIQAPENIPGSVEQRLRERLSAADGSDAWRWLVAHEMGHCALWFLRAQGEAPAGEKVDIAAEAFADIFALEWARRLAGGPPKWGAELTRQRRQSLHEHATAPALEVYWRGLREGEPMGSICQVALRIAEPSWAPRPLSC